jgi:hypothetical protein
MALLTNAGRSGLAQAVADKADVIYLALGEGDPDWDVTPEEATVNETALVAELGRRLLTSVLFVVPDLAGEILTPSGTYSVSETPTPYLLFRFVFDLTDSPNAVIREVGMFIDSTVVAGLPAGQRYFSPAEVDDQGILLAVERFTAFTRSADVRQIFQFVLPF